MRRRVLLPILAALPLLTGACATSLDATKVGVPVTLAGQNAQPTPGAAFKVRKSAVYGLWGLATLGAPSLDRILATQLVGARQIADVKVKVRSRWSDVLFTVLTAGLIVPRTVEVEGVVVGDSTAAAPAR